MLAKDQRGKANPVNIAVERIIDRISAGILKQASQEPQQFSQASTTAMIKSGRQSRGQRINPGISLGLSGINLLKKTGQESVGPQLWVKVLNSIQPPTRLRPHQALRSLLR